MRALDKCGGHPHTPCIRNIGVCMHSRSQTSEKRCVLPKSPTKPAHCLASTPAPVALGAGHVDAWRGCSSPTMGEQLVGTARRDTGAHPHLARRRMGRAASECDCRGHFRRLQPLAAAWVVPPARERCAVRRTRQQAPRSDCQGDFSRSQAACRGRACASSPHARLGGRPLPCATQLPIRTSRAAPFGSCQPARECAVLCDARVSRLRAAIAEVISDDCSPFQTIAAACRGRACASAPPARRAPSHKRARLAACVRAALFRHRLLFA